MTTAPPPGPTTPPQRSLTNKLVRFLLAGGPMFAVAMPINWLLVSRFQVNKPLAYGVVLLCQSTVNFFVCRWFVFQEVKPRSAWSRFLKFISGIFAFRVADWAVYVLATSFLGVPYLAMQVANVTIFSLLKFAYARRVLES